MRNKKKNGIVKQLILVLILMFTLYLPYFTDPVTAAASNNLASISFEGLSLDQDFDPSKTNYTATVNSEVQQTTVRPIAQESTATIKVNGGKVESGGKSNTIALTNPTASADSTTTIIITVSALDGSLQTYTFVITRKYTPSVQNAQIINVSETSVTLTWTYPKDRTDISSVQIQKDGVVIYALASVNSQYTVNGLTKGRSGTFQLVAFNRLGQAGSPVSVSYNSDQQSNDKLLSLTASEPLLNAYLSSSFSAFTNNYTYAYSSYTTSQITLTPVLADSTAKVTINGQSVNSGSASSAISLATGTNTTIDIRVTMPNGVQGSRYVLTVNMPASTKNALSNLMLSGATLDKTFDPAKTSYTATVPNGISSVTLTPVVDAKSIIKVNNSVVSYSGSATVQLNVGLNKIIIDATGETGRVQTYTLEITRQLPTAAGELISLSVGGLTLNEPFSSARYNYTVDAPYDRYSVVVIPTVSAASSVIKVNGNVVTSGSSYNVNMTVGSNLIRIDVTGPSGTSHTYFIQINRTMTTSTPLLFMLSLESVATTQSGSTTNTSSQPITFNEIFDPARTVYTTSVPYQTSSVLFKTTPYSSSYAVMNGAMLTRGYTEPLPLNVGPNTFTIYAYNNSNDSKTVYTVYVTRLDLNGTTQGIGAKVGEQKKSTVHVSGDQIVLTASMDPQVLEYAPTLHEMTNAVDQNSSSKGITFKIGEIGENRGMTNNLSLGKDALGFLKQKEMPLRILTESVAISVSLTDLPTSSAKITVRKSYETEQQFPKFVQIIVPSVKITIEGDNKQLPMNVEVQTKLPFSQSDRTLVFQNGTKIKSSTNQDNKGAKQFKINGSAELTLGFIDRRFEDMAGHWASKEVNYMANKMLINGYEDNTFKPEESITRAEFVSMIVNAVNEKGIALDKSPYVDVSEKEWYFKALSIATSLQLVEGSDTNEFRPNDIVSREEMATMFYRLMKYLKMDISMTANQTAEALKVYTDVEKISSWAALAFAACVQADIISGTSSTSLSPKVSGSRAQTATMLYRLLAKTNGF